MAVVISLRNLPLTATYGLSSLFFYCAAALLFMIPYALVSAELASGWPKAGGVYIWVKEAMGEKWGFFAIWMQWFHNMTWYPAMLSFVAAGIAYVFKPELATNKTYLTTVILVGFWSITLLNFLGIRFSALVSTLCLILGTIVPGLVLITLGILWLALGEPLQISFTASKLLPSFDLSNLVFLAGIFLALSGMEANANLAREVKNPQKNFPKAIFLATGMILAILIFGSLAIAMILPKEQINLVAGLLDTFKTSLDLLHLSWLLPVMAIFIVIGALGELNAWTIAGAKGLFVTTEHGSLPPILHKMNRRHVPVNLLLFQGLIVTTASFMFISLPNINISYWILSAISAQIYILMYILLFLAAIVLRYKRPEVQRSYRIPGKKAGMWIVSLIGLASCLIALFFSFIPPSAFAVGSLWTYELILGGGFVITCLIPLTIYLKRRPHWQREVLSDIRQEIHKDTH